MTAAPAHPLDPARFFQLSSDLVCVASAEGYFLEVNPAFTAALGYSREELLAAPLCTFLHPDDRDAAATTAHRMDPHDTSIELTNRYVCKDGTIRWLQWRAVIDEHGHTYGVARDVTRARAAEDARRKAVEDLQRSEARLTASLNEREVLLHEVHHRVKNNLQIISSLISLQSRQLSPGDARKALDECRARVETITLIHETLYQSADYARVPFAGYARTLADNIHRASGASPDRVHFEIDIEEIALPVDRAIPCGLVLNELLGNAFRHAFPGARRGRIHLRLAALPDDKALLAVEDDGVGLPPDFDPQRATSLGMTLISTLTRQLDGTLEIKGSTPGTHAHVTFPLRRTR